jgi:hypothetical protein
VVSGIEAVEGTARPCLAVTGDSLFTGMGARNAAEGRTTTANIKEESTAAKPRRPRTIVSVSAVIRANPVINDRESDQQGLWGFRREASISRTPQGGG